MSMTMHSGNFKFPHAAAPRRLRLFTLYAATALVALLSVHTALAQSDEAANAASSSHVRTYKFQPKHGVDKVPERVGGPTAAPGSSPAGAHLTYYGGRVVSAMQVVMVLWGSGSYDQHVVSTGTPSMRPFTSRF